MPETVREWFVEVAFQGSTVDDWCDYDGYDDSTEAQREQQMAVDVLHVVNRLIARELRYVADGRQPSRGVLEWSAGTAWQVAVPFDSDD